MLVDPGFLRSFPLECPRTATRMDADTESVHPWKGSAKFSLDTRIETV